MTSGKAVINKKHNKIIVWSGNEKKRIKIKIIKHPYQDSNGNLLMIIDAGDFEATLYKR